MGDLSRNKKNAQDECIYVDDLKCSAPSSARFPWKVTPLWIAKMSRNGWNYWNCCKYKFGSHLNWSFQQNRMSKLHKFTFCREHSNCLCLLCDTHLLKQSRKQSQEGHKAAHHGSFNQSTSIVNNNKKTRSQFVFFFSPLPSLVTWCYRNIFSSEVEPAK